MKNEFLQRLIISGTYSKNMELRAAELIVSNQINIFTITMWNQPEKIVWSNMVMPTEIFYAAGLIPVNIELVAGWISSLGLVSKYIGIAEAKGFDINICSYHKCVIGAMECGDIPPPRIAVLSSHICDGGAGMAKYFKDRFHTKTILIDIPYYFTKLSLSHTKAQFLNVMSFLEDHIAHDISNNALEQAVSLSNSAREYMRKANDLRKEGCFFYGNYAIRNLFGITFLHGSELGLEASKKYYEQLLDIKQMDGNRHITAKEHKRILWIHFAPLYAGEIMKYFERELNCIIAFDILSYVYWPSLDARDPYNSIAEKAMSHFYLGKAEKRMRLYETIIEEYRIDGIVMFMHQGCRAIPGSSWEIRKIVNQSDIPFLELSGDCLDPRGHSSEQMKLRMEAFSENLERKK